MITGYAAHEAKGQLKKFEFDPGSLEATAVEIDVMYCGICHSDVSMINNDWGISEYPMVPGHEVVGKIAKIGSEVTSLQVGQVVGLGWHSSYCHECANCHSGDFNLCREADATILSKGGFADKVRASADSVVPIPDGIDLKTAGPLFCGGITVFTPLFEFDIKPTSKVAVIGIGGLGHMAVQFLKAWGCEVTAFTSSERKRKEAFELGAHHTLNSKDEDEIKSAANRFDLIISTVNVELDWNLYLSTLATRGRLHFVGATLEPVKVDVFQLFQRISSISGSQVGSPLVIANMLEFVKRHQIQPVVEVMPMSEVNNAIEKLKNGDVHYRIVLSNLAE